MAAPYFTLSLSFFPFIFSFSFYFSFLFFFRKKASTSLPYFLTPSLPYSFLPSSFIKCLPLSIHPFIHPSIRREGLSIGLSVVDLACFTLSGYLLIYSLYSLVHFICAVYKQAVPLLFFFSFFCCSFFPFFPIFSFPSLFALFLFLFLSFS